MENNTMDNQQERLIRIKELSWLSGIIDGEGCLTLRYHKRKDNFSLIKPTFSVVNTSKIIIDEIIRILDKYEIPHWVSYFDKNVEKNHKPKWEIHIIGIKRLLKFLPLVDEYIIGKKEECSILLEFCNGRLGMNGKPNSVRKYSSYEYGLVYKIKQLHLHQDQIDLKKYKDLLESSETIR